MKLEKHEGNQKCADCIRFKTCAPQIAHKGQLFCVYTPTRFTEEDPHMKGART